MKAISRSRSIASILAIGAAASPRSASAQSGKPIRVNLQIASNGGAIYPAIASGFGT